MIRLNKYIAHYSSYSRREADVVIEKGYVRINGEIVDNPATQVDETRDIVYVSGKKVAPTEKYTVIVYNKPKGELVTKTDPRGRRTIYDTLGNEFKHFIPVGRLDFATEGVLLMTDASKVATALMTSNLERVYKIKIKGSITPQMEEAMLNGLELEDASAGAHSKSKITSMTFAPFLGYKIDKNAHNFSTLKIALSEGQNREIRRFFAHFGAEVADLKRVSFAEIELNNLPTGKTRFLSRSEYSALFNFLKEENKKEKEKAKPKALGQDTEKSKDAPYKKDYTKSKDDSKRKDFSKSKDTPQKQDTAKPKYPSQSKGRYKK
ncbi:MAG: pseudouridine synthase [Sulfurimonadaceae bacterium]|jgi:23S rRNA pseudouridine2605 synthase|nr:pseudouridine synthase [Sulfurimonadaceae bacterium]